VATHYGKNSGSGIVDQGKRTTKFFKVVEQREAKELFLNSGQVEADYGKDCGCPPLWAGKILAIEHLRLYHDH
jgi:hypothetical protein